MQHPLLFILLTAWTLVLTGSSTTVLRAVEPTSFPAGYPVTRVSEGDYTERLPPVAASPNNDPDQAGTAVAGDFPPLPPDPNADKLEPLPPLEEELWRHGGSYLYCPEGDRLNWPGEFENRHPMLRLPEDWQEPRPFTLFSEFLGADPIFPEVRWKWPGPCGYSWEPRFVGYGEYQLFGFALEQNRRRQDVIGHHLQLELDLRLTATERFHVQFRPVGERNTGGSFYQFSTPAHYEDNATAVPDRYWFEGELHSIFGSYVDPFSALDYHVVVGRFPFALHNFLLINDDMTGVVFNKNTIYWGPLSNLNVQAFYGLTYAPMSLDPASHVTGVHVSADHRHAFYEGSYIFTSDAGNTLNPAAAAPNAHYAALSRTQFYGPITLAGRALVKWGDASRPGSGQLFVLETNYTRAFEQHPLGVEYGVFYANAFAALDGWTSIAGGNFNRLRTAFETNPLVRIAAGAPVGDRIGAAFGVQLFRRHEDESIVPECAFESVRGVPVWGVGLRYLRKTSARTFFEVLGVANFSDDPALEREGVFLSETLVF